MKKRIVLAVLLLFVLGAELAAKALGDIAAAAGDDEKDYTP